MVKKFYITTTIPYTNAPPHLGFALEVIQADVIARWNSLNGKNVFFLTGADEHGTKNYRTAEKQGLTPQEFVDKNSGYLKKLIDGLNISNNFFIRTTDKKNHWPGVIKIWKQLEKSGDIYKKKYSGQYCSGCERFVTEKDLVDGQCPDHPTLKIETILEENYFFRLSKYSDKIKKLVEDDELKIYPKQWKNNFLALAKDGLTDVSFSRSKQHLSWGIPVPDDDKQVMYVWCDALVNYLTGIGYPDKKYKNYWPADIHVVGKDMLRFHAGIWPGILLSAGLPLPKEIIVHGFLTVDGKKMSKSVGNVVSPLELLEKYPADSIRYYLCRSFVFGQDGDFSEKALINRHNDELGNKLGNLVSRISALAEKYGIEKTTNNLVKKLTKNKIAKLIDSYKFDKALNEIFSFVDICNEYVQSQKPWKTKDRKVLFELVDSIREVAKLLSPFIPKSTDKISEIFESDEIKKAPVLFEKIDLPKQNINKTEKPKEIMEGVAMIDFGDFAKMDLRVAEIQKVNNIDGADKLYKLEISLGDEVRTICAGIKQFYSHEDLRGKKIIVLTNLKPRKLQGIESCGMLLAASNQDHSKVSLISPDQDMEVGSLVG